MWDYVRSMSQGWHKIKTLSEPQGARSGLYAGCPSRWDHGECGRVLALSKASLLAYYSTIRMLSSMIVLMLEQCGTLPHLRVVMLALVQLLCSAKRGNFWLESYDLQMDHDKCGMPARLVAGEHHHVENYEFVYLIAGCALDWAFENLTYCFSVEIDWMSAGRVHRWFFNSALPKVGCMHWWRDYYVVEVSCY